MNVLRAIFCCTCCAAVDDDDQYHNAYRGLVEDHFRNEIESFAKKRRSEHSVSFKANINQITHRNNKLRKLVKEQWTTFRTQFDKFRPILDFLVFQRLDQAYQLDQVSADPRSLGIFSSQRASYVQTPALTQRPGGQVDYISPSERLTVPHSARYQEMQSMQPLSSEVILEKRMNEIILMYAMLTYLVDDLGILLKDQDEGQRDASRYGQEMPRFHRMNLRMKDSLPTVADDESANSFAQQPTMKMRQKSAHISANRLLLSNLETRVNPQLYEEVQHVGFPEAHTLLAVESAGYGAGEIDENSFETDSIQQLRQEDEMDRKETQWNISVQIVDELRQIVRERKTFFHELYQTKVAKKCSETDFFRFFDLNWQIRKYTKESARVTDEIVKKVSQKESMMESASQIGNEIKVEEANSPVFNKRAVDFLDQSPILEIPSFSTEEMLLKPVVTRLDQENTGSKLDVDAISSEIEDLKVKQTAAVEHALEKHTEIQKKLRQMLDN